MPSALTRTVPLVGGVATAQPLPPSPEGVSFEARVPERSEDHTSEPESLNLTAYAEFGAFQWLLLVLSVGSLLNIGGHKDVA